MLDSLGLHHWTLQWDQSEVSIQELGRKYKPLNWLLMSHLYCGKMATLILWPWPTAITVAAIGDTEITLPENTAQIFASTWPEPKYSGDFTYSWVKLFGPGEGTISGENNKNIQLTGVGPASSFWDLFSSPLCFPLLQPDPSPPSLPLPSLFSSPRSPLSLSLYFLSSFPLFSHPPHTRIVCANVCIAYSESMFRLVVN